jgi:hypothetical protein
VSDHSLDQLAAMSPLEVCAALQTAPHGLDEAEARKRRERYGPNAIADTLPVSTFRRLADLVRQLDLVDPADRRIAGIPQRQHR